jgi:hypothetical protein
MARVVFILSFFPEFTIYFNKGCFSIHGDFLLENREKFSDEVILDYMRQDCARAKRVSLMLRIRDYDDSRSEHTSTLVITGFTKPLIGEMSSLFTTSVISSRILPLEHEIIEGTAFYFVA